MPFRSPRNGRLGRIPFRGECVGFSACGNSENIATFAQFQIHRSMNRDRLVTPSYCCILLANFLLFFGFYLLMPVMPFYLTEVFGGRARYGGRCALLLCDRCAFDPAVLGLFARYVCPQTALSTGLFCVYRYFRGLPGSRNPDAFHDFPRGARLCVRGGYGVREYRGNRYHALVAPRRGIGITVWPTTSRCRWGRWSGCSCTSPARSRRFSSVRSHPARWDSRWLAWCGLRPKNRSNANRFRSTGLSCSKGYRPVWICCCFRSPTE